MKKLDNFTNCLDVLADADFKMAETNDIYRTGVIGQFNLTFELAWKALQEIMRKHGVDELITQIRDIFIPAFTVLKDTLVKKLDEAESDW